MASKRALWSDNDLVLAVKAVQSGRLSTYKAAEKYSIPRRTIRNHLQTDGLRKSLDLLRLIYEKMTRVEKELETERRTNEEIKKLLLNRTEFLQQPEGLPELPLRTFADAERAEDLAKANSAIKEYIVEKLSFAGKGQSDGECAKKVMAQLFTNHVGTHFNWRGKNNKVAFGDWVLREAVELTVKKLRPTMDTSQVQNGVKEWLKSRKFVNHEPK